MIVAKELAKRTVSVDAVTFANLATALLPEERWLKDDSLTLFVFDPVTSTLKRLLIHA